MIRRCMLVCLLLMAQFASAQTSHPERYTNSYTNGRYWLAMSLEAKLTCLEIARDAMNAGTSLLGPAVSPATGKAVYEFYIPPTSMTLGDIIESLDKFYAEVENRPIPILVALTVVSARGRGNLSEATIQQWILDDRKKAAADSAAEQARPSVPSNTLSTPTGVKKQ